VGELSKSAGEEMLAQTGERILGLVTKLSLELHPHRRGQPSGSLDAHLDKDFGLDSLGRVELIARLEQDFGVRVSDTLFAEAETPRDLLLGVLRARDMGGAPALARIERLDLPSAMAAPENAATLLDVLEWHAARHPGRPHILLSDGEREEAPITYADLARRAKIFAGALKARGFQTGETAAIMLPTGAEFFTAFFGALYAGGVPVPIYPPFRLAQIEEHLERQVHILCNAEAAYLVTFEQAGRAAQFLKERVPSIRETLVPENLMSGQEVGGLPKLSATSTAFLQYTSGSTGDPKGVILTHANLLANIRAMGRAMQARSSDVFVSWLPLYHDMGLIGAWLASLYYAVPLIVMSPLAFLARPERWLWTMHRTRATISAAPNFALELCASRIPYERLQGLDLSSLRLLVDGSEPVAPSTTRRFTEKFAPFGFRAGALVPGYGLAECAVGLTLPAPDEGVLVDRIEKHAFLSRLVAVPAGATEASVLEFVSCGHPLIGHEVRVVDGTGREVAERTEGRLQFRGPSATPGYYRSPEKTKTLLVDGWYETGDLGYIAGGNVFVTGRTKDIILRAGRHIHPAEVEAAVEGLSGVETHGTVLFGAPDPSTGTERLIFVVETPLTDETLRQHLRDSIESVSSVILEQPVDEIILAAPGTIPKTSSGKIRRPAIRDAYLSGRPLERRQDIGRQLARMTLAAGIGRLRRIFQKTDEWIYSRYWWAVVILVGVFVAPLVYLLPRLSWRWQAIRTGCRAALFLMGHPLTVKREGVPLKGRAIVVSNHSSYFDHVVLAAILPGELSFAAKNDLAPRLFQGSILKRLDTLFVERFEAKAGVADTEEAMKKANRGRLLVFYPEATIMRMPGLLDFRMGAFLIAARLGIPIVPVAISGTRSILRHDLRWFPRRGKIAVHVGQPIHPRADDFEAAVELKNAARADILAHCGEPDLAGETPIY
jgi:1-acyl-sn-glycerol-3-phosphate acyltransferase